MKICFLTDTIYEIGGVERVLCVLANALSNHHDVTILCTKKIVPINYYFLADSVNVEVIDNIKDGKHNYLFRKIIRRINMKKSINNAKIVQEIYYPKCENKKYISVLKDRFDVVIGVRDVYTMRLAIISDDINARCYGWFHNSYEAYFKTYGYYSWHQDILFERYLKKLDGCVVLTKSDEILFGKAFNYSFKKIYNPITCLDSVTEEERDIDILFVARLERKQKGLDFLVNILAKVKSVIPTVNCVVVGNGSGKEYLQNEVERRKMSENVSLIGESKKVSKYYNRAKLLINTSRWEGFGLVITEAMNYGVPIVSFKTTGPNELVVNNECGYLIECYDEDAFAKSVIKLLIDDNVRENMRRAAYERAMIFSENEIVNDWEKMIVTSKDRM